MSKSTHQQLEPLIAKLKSDTEHYARRKIILAKQQQLIGLGQLNFILSPIQQEDNYFQFNMLLPRQMMTVTMESQCRKKTGVG
jgi:hypothetical protein